MIKKITFLFLACSSMLMYGQTMINDFEAGSAAPIDAAGGLTFLVATNPITTGLNTSANCLQVGRTASQWWGYVGIDVAPNLAISATDTKFLSMMVLYNAQPDIGARLDAADDASAGSGAGVIRPLNKYTTINEWQEIVFEIKDTPTATSFTKGTLFRVSLHSDMGFENDPVGNVLPITNDVFGYVDQIRVLDANPLNTDSFKLDATEISIFPNSVKTSFKVTSKNVINITNVSLFNILGKDVTKNMSKLDKQVYDISSLSAGVYIAKITEENGKFTTKKIIKE